MEMMSDENQHVQFLQRVLTGATHSRPTFQKLAQSDTPAFLALACQLEERSVGVYLLLSSLLTGSTPLLSVGTLHCHESPQGQSPAALPLVHHGAQPTRGATLGALTNGRGRRRFSLVGQRHQDNAGARRGMICRQSA